jgi:hypothetical protein
MYFMLKNNKYLITSTPSLTGSKQYWKTIFIKIRLPSNVERGLFVDRSIHFWFSFGRGLLNRSTAQYFYKVSIKSLLKLISIFWNNIFLRKHVFKYFVQLLLFKNLSKRNKIDVICIFITKWYFKKNLYYTTLWWSKQNYTDTKFVSNNYSKDIFSFLCRRHSNINLICFCSVYTYIEPQIFWTASRAVATWIG